MSRHLFGFERAWARAALDAIYPAAACKALPQGIATSDVDGFMDDLFVHVPLMVWLGLRVAIWIVALAPIVLLRRLATITTLRPADRAVVLQRLVASQRYAVRQLVIALKATGGMLYGSTPGVRAQVQRAHGPRSRVRGKLRLPLLEAAGEVRRVQ
jgi:hypothetical protein